MSPRKQKRREYIPIHCMEPFSKNSGVNNRKIIKFYEKPCLPKLDATTTENKSKKQEMNTNSQWEIPENIYKWSWSYSSVGRVLT